MYTAVDTFLRIYFQPHQSEFTVFLFHPHHILLEKLKPSTGWPRPRASVVIIIGVFPGALGKAWKLAF